MLLLPSLATIIGFVILALSADRFVLGSAAIARNYGINPLLIGLTIVALGTSAPEIVVAIVAALQHNSHIAIGNAIGSNIANIGLVLGLTALLVPISVDSKLLRREFPILFLVMLLTGILILDNYLSRLDGFLLLLGLVCVIMWFCYQAIKTKSTEPMAQEYSQEIPTNIKNSRAVFWLIVGMIGLAISSRIIVWGSVLIAKYFGLSDLVIGLTVVAIGTSLPELAASIMGIIKSEHDIAIGNIIGSNIFNLCAVLAMPALIHPTKLTNPLITQDFPFMLALTILFYLASFGFRKKGKISRLEGLILLCLYLGYLAWLIFKVH